MQPRQAKGIILEELVKVFLAKQGFKVIDKQTQGYYGLKEKNGILRLSGRGCSHQIDALGQLLFPIPFVYPVRLLCEAKCLNKKVDLEVIRNFTGVMKDISENYFADKKSKQELIRFTDCGAIFSTSDFSLPAQQYAFAHGIHLLRVPDLKPAVDYIYQHINPPINHKNILEQTNRLIRNSQLISQNYYFGMAAGLYPITIVSNTPLNLNQFFDTDTADMTISAIKNDFGKIEYLEIHQNNWRGKIFISKHLFKKYFSKTNKLETLNSKVELFSNIDIPIIINSMRRIIKLNLDKNWVQITKALLEQNPKSPVAGMIRD
ncbi:MAG: restriction endonuclease [archaeon]|jgi:hypothetical protein